MELNMAHHEYRDGLSLYDRNLESLRLAHDRLHVVVLVCFFSICISLSQSLTHSISFAYLHWWPSPTPLDFRAHIWWTQLVSTESSPNGIQWFSLKHSTNAYDSNASISGTHTSHWYTVHNSICQYIGIAMNFMCLIIIYILLHIAHIPILRWCTTVLSGRVLWLNCRLMTTTLTTI